MFKTSLASMLLCVLTMLPLQAADLPVPEGRILLQVRGAITNFNIDGAAEFDLEMMRDLDWREIETYTSFTDGPQNFAGPTLQSLLDAVGANGSRLIATAINDYFVEIPVVHARDHDVILAIEMNGRLMRVRDKGPIWLVYPLSEEETAEKPFDNEMIWQLIQFEVIE
ncbi:molybdopterin-dependent oxidoreductase [Parasedimentitalea huanghaiensis]|uniref:Molybdopterin-dependent oxidoreductase n=1 Tax=Parasedimentitalea huanghaiensis TaxID=2682100 RepID=A0A6L6WF69_9RHOB|nr:molybdopterin-dependent oxidoreductase [Zongyanglinia huanghaiensis]MVO14292.1 molybdopterin-dependent oxidoreductase [Zongyanglinia huanghaiensis]